MNKRLSILAPTRYPWRFNSPRHSRHDISIRKFLPMNRLNYRLEGITVFNPFPLKRFDLIHTFNRIPVSSLPFVMGYESHMPRAYGLEHTAYYRAMARRLAGPKCRRIVAISNYAKRLLLRQHEGQAWLGDITAKLEVRYPNMDIPIAEDIFEHNANDPIRLVFVGNHFGRKGGCVALRLAELALADGLPLEMEIISGLEVGIVSWVDPLQTGFFASDFAKLQQLPNVRYSRFIPNAELMARVARAHFSLLPTFADTFGFSVIEAMAHHTPVITTAQGVMPEFIRDGQNGILLPLECDQYGDWIHMKRNNRDSTVYEKLFRDQNNQLAETAFARIKQTLANPSHYLNMRKAARITAEEHFCAQKADTYWDNLYEASL